MASLEYALTHDSEQFLDQERSSKTQTLSNLVAVTLFNFSRVAKSVIILENTI